ncbi:toxin-activating lysine-acyltransferase [Phaeobacter sp. C3_T13_0]|uniref:toxin-activating lysine-acyltransferase n=1 Tax=Phaeobacter cretensis TaxID=3342641 RepID=UPI0039BC85EB
MDHEQNFHTYGKIAWLWSNSVLHRDWTVNQQAEFILPAIACQQYYIVERNGYPVAYCSWALLDEETEARYILNPSRLDPDGWTCGDRLWFVDWISPFSPKYTWALRSALVKRYPDKVARAMRVKKDSDTARIASFTGHGLKKDESRVIKRQYYEDMVESLASNPKRGEDFFLSGIGPET